MSTACVTVASPCGPMLLLLLCLALDALLLSGPSSGARSPPMWVGKTDGPRERARRAAVVTGDSSLARRRPAAAKSSASSVSDSSSSSSRSSPA
jgi:hypothetical protein